MRFFAEYMLGQVRGIGPKNALQIRNWFPKPVGSGDLGRSAVGATRHCRTRQSRPIIEADGSRVAVDPGRTLLDVIALEQDLQELLGRRVDVLTDGGLSPYLQERILAEAASL